MAFKDKITNFIITYSKFVTLGIGLTITFGVGTAIEMVDHSSIYIHYSGHGGRVPT